MNFHKWTSEATKRVYTRLCGMYLSGHWSKADLSVVLGIHEDLPETKEDMLVAIKVNMPKDVEDE